ncbi:hypothetical protein JYT15_00250 [Acidimicrobium ferrooxidans]|nr:hypothetical protein [Acidimicrobium ferrooxidans]
MTDEPTCRFCPNGLATHRSKSHIIPEALGWTLFTEHATCDECNPYFGRTVEAAIIARYDGPIRQLIAPQCKRAMSRATASKLTSTGRRIKIGPGGVPMGTKVDLIRDEDGNPKSIVAPNLKAARKHQKWLGGDRKDHKFTESHVPFYDIYEHDIRVYGLDCVRFAAKALLEFGYAVAERLDRHDLSIDMNSDVFRPAARLARHSIPYAAVETDYIHAYPHCMAVLRNTFLEGGAEASQFAHRIMLVFDSQASCVWGVVSLFDSEVWMIRLTDRCAVRTSLTCLYQRAILKGQDDWFDNVDGVPLPLARFEDKSLPFDRSSSEILKRHYDDLRHAAIDFCESNSPAGLVDGLLSSAPASGQILPDHILEGIEKRLQLIFGRLGAVWTTEWPRIHADFLSRVPVGLSFEQDVRDDLGPSAGEFTEYCHSAYSELFRRCCQNIGVPGKATSTKVTMGNDGASKQ